MKAVALVVAKAPIAGRVKTRLAEHVGAVAAAQLATAALLDTLDSCEQAFAECFLAVEGELDGPLSSRLRGWTVLPQRGDLLGERLANAFADVAERSSSAVVQVGMDTPQSTAAHLEEVAGLLAGVDAVVGPAVDGGWWVLGVRNAIHAQSLSGVGMSAKSTYADTVAALRSVGATVGSTRALVDVDTVTDARLVASQAPTTRFARAWSQVVS